MSENPTLPTTPATSDTARPVSTGAHIGHALLRALGVFGAALALYGAIGLALVELDRTVLHQPGDYGSTYLPGCGGSLLIGLILLAVAVLVGRPIGLAWRPRGGWRLLPLTLGVVILAYGFLTSVGAIWYDIHYVENGVVGASFAILGVWMAWFLCFPLGALFLALGLGRRR